MSNTLPGEVRPVEKVLLAAEQPPWSAVYRLAIGFAVLPFFFRCFGKNAPAWELICFFTGILLGLRLAPAAVRHLFPFSKKTQEIWAWQRLLAKRHDSYQWRKLFWIGLGLALYIALSGRFRIASAAITVICLIGGGLGLFFWRRVLVRNPLRQEAPAKVRIATPTVSNKTEIAP